MVEVGREDVFFFFGSCGSSGKEGILSFEYVISINTIFDTLHKERISLRYIRAWRRRLIVVG